MQMTKKVVSVVIAVMMVVSMMAVGTVVAYADAENAGTIENLADLVYAMNNGGTYELTGDISISSGYIVIKEGVDLTLTGNGSITSASKYMFVVNGGTLTLKGGTYTDTYAVANDDYSYVVWNQSNGTFNVSGSKVTLNANSPEYEKATGIGTYKATTNFTSGKINAEGWGMTFLTNAKVNIAGGTINSTGYGISSNGNAGNGGYEVNVSGGTINGGELGIYHNNTGTLNISGGTVNGETGLYIKSGVTNITAGKINGTGDKNSYHDWQNGGHPTGDAIVLDYDQAYQNGGPVDVNIYGGTINSKNAQPISDNTREGNEAIHDTDVIYGGTFKSTNDTVDTTVIDKLAAVNLTYDTTNGTVSSDHLAIVDGVYYDDFATACEASQGGKVVYLLKALASTDSYTLKVTNTIDNPVLVSPYDTSVTKFVLPSGPYNRKSASKIVDGVKVKAVYFETAAVVNTTQNKGYSDLMSALNDAVDGDVIDITANVSPSFMAVSAKVENKAVTVNLNGNTVKFRDATIGEGGNLTINGPGTINSGYNGTFLVTKGKLTVNGAEINSTQGFAICGNGTAGNDGYEINILNSSITATKGAAIYHCNNGTLTVSGSSVITGPVAVYIKSGTTFINNGTFHATGAAADYTYNGNGINVTGDAIVVDNCGYPGGAPTVNIVNGTFKSDNADAVASYTYNDNDEVNNFIEGGNFSSDVSEFAKDGYISEAKGNVEGAPFVLTPDPNPLNHDNHIGAITASQARGWDSNRFGLPNDMKYLAGTILGVQKKAQVAAVTSQSGQETGKDVRFVAVLDTDVLRAATDYGFVLAKVNKDTNRKYSNTNFENLKANWGNGEKTISAKDTFNNVCGNADYGNPNTSTDYKYITCAVNGVADNEYVVARFYVTIGGKTYYGKYAGHNYHFTGCMTDANATAIAG